MKFEGLEPYKEGLREHSESLLALGTQGHVPKQPLLGSAFIAVFHGRNHFVILRWLVKTLVTIDMSQGKPLQKEVKEIVSDLITVVCTFLQKLGLMFPGRRFLTRAPDFSCGLHSRKRSCIKMASSPQR